MNEILQDELRLLIQDLLGMPDGSVRPRNFTQPNEGKSFAMVHVGTIRNVGWSGDIPDGPQYAEAEITFDFFGENAIDYASSLHKVLQSNKAVEGFERLKIGYLSSEPVKDLTALELERFNRYQTSINVSFLINLDKDNFVVNEFGEIHIILRAEP